MEGFFGLSAAKIRALDASWDPADGAPVHVIAAVTGATVQADEAPTLHVYLVDEGSECSHEAWLDPGYDEWADAVEG